MQRIWLFLLDPRVLAVIGILALVGLLLSGADAFRVGGFWAAGVVVLLAWVALGIWFHRGLQARRAGQAFQQADEVAALRERISDAVKRIKTSRLGETSGSAALYELPWYAIIGNPAAGKSSAIVKSGLTFPFAENTDAIVQSIGGTRRCDWYFTTQGILIDTAGRYAVQEEDHREWLGFLKLLKVHRPKAPLNGVIIAASIAELANQRADVTIDLARKLRQRVQDLIEQLEVFVPVYVVFTKADLIAGFVDFFEDQDRSERDRVWGATLPCDPQMQVDAASQFDLHMDVLYQGLKEASVARMTLHRGEQLPPGVLTFPLEFVALKPSLRTFLHTLFEDNPYQFRPLFRGFYFTSAVQEGQSTSRASQRVADQFGLQLQVGTVASVYSQSGFFLKELFSRVMFADRELVRQYTSRSRSLWRQVAFFGGMAGLGILLAAWTWSYTNNLDRVARVEADLLKAVKVQDQKLDLASRMEALEILQDRLEQVQRDRRSAIWSMGLSQDAHIEKRLIEEYFMGLESVLLKPSAQALAAYLADANAQADNWRGTKPVGAAVAAPPAAEAASQPASQGAPSVSKTAISHYQASSGGDVTEAYNALKAYLMLGDRQRLEPGHMGDQLTRYWREWLEVNRGAMPREQMIRRAERIVSFAMSQMAHPAFPQMELDVTLLDSTRESLRRVVKGMPARERVYGEIKARAATRFPAVTVASIVGEGDRQVLAGSHVVSGAFTREAWHGYVRDAIKEAAHHSLQSADWVLKTATADDLTLEGSPEQIQKALTQLYKAEYAQQWGKFIQGTTVVDFQGFDQAVERMQKLGDPVNSPVGVLLQALHDQTGWDNPSAFNDRLAPGQQGLIGWFKNTVLGMTPTPVHVAVSTDQFKADEVPTGPIGRAFAGVNRLMLPREGGQTLARSYLDALSRVRARLNQMKHQGDLGPGARQFMHQTLEGKGELVEALKLVDEQLLTGLDEGARNALRPILVRPLMQAFAVLVPISETELNRVWAAQVFDPYQRTLAGKYPFDRGSRMEASATEVAVIFGASGAVAKFLEQSLGALVVRRGDQLAPRTWADMGVRLRPAFSGGLGSWVAPLAGQDAGVNQGSGGTDVSQTSFQILPQPAPGLTEYTIEIDGQVLRYRQGAASWQPFVWPGPGSPGVRITGLTFDGRRLTFLNEPGRFGLERMINAAQRRRLGGEAFELKWAQSDVGVAVQLRIVSNGAAAQPAPAASGRAGAWQGGLPAAVAGVSHDGP